jgi:hypothetical protein
MPKFPRFVKYGLILIAASVLVVRLLATKESELTLFSSNTSPDGLFVAENFMVDGCLGECSTGRIIIHNANSKQSGQINFSEPVPDIFFRWIDGTNLLILFNGASEALPDAPRELAGIHISYSTYPYLTASAASARARQSKMRTLDERDLSATYSSNANPHYLSNGKTCTLKITANDTHEFKTIGIDINAHTGSCTNPKLKGNSCGAIESHFWVGRQIDGSSRRILTSADVSGANGYGTLPTGANHLAIRGEFFDYSANRVVHALKNSPFSVDYNFDFVDLNLKYKIPTTSISQQISDFTKCVGNTDFEWLKHIQ